MPPTIKGKWRGRPRTFHRDQFVVVTKGQGGTRGRLRLYPVRPAGAPGPTAFDFTDKNLLDLIPTGLDPADILFVEPDFAVEGQLDAEGLPNDQYINGVGARIQWSVRRIDMAGAWSDQQGNDSVLVAVVDTGLHDHIDLDMTRFLYGGNYRTLLDEFAPNGTFVSAMPTEMQNAGNHGTEMTGVIAAMANNEEGIAGMNWNTPVGICQALEPDATGTASSVLASVLQAIMWADDPKKNLVINLSLTETDIPVEERFDTGSESLTFDYMCEVADAKDNVILVCATGNHSGPVRAPALYSDKYPNTVVAVGETMLKTVDGVITKDRLDDGEFSEEVTATSNSGVQVTVVAPGYNMAVLKNRNEYDTAGGNSIAAAHVTGLASLMWSHAPELTSGEIIQRIKDNTWMPGGVAVPNDSWGYGRIDAGKALKSVEKVPVVGLVLDRSESMNRPAGDEAGSRRIDVLRNAVETIVRILEPHSTVVVVDFNDTANGARPITEIDPDDPTTSRTNITDQVAALQAQGMTSIGAGVETGASRLSEISDAQVTGVPHKAIVLITDGKENRAPRINPHGDDRLVDLQGLGVPVHSIGAGVAEVLDVAALETLTSATQGSHLITGGWGEGTEQMLTKYLYQHLIQVPGDTQIVDPTGFIKPGDDSIDVPFAVSGDDRRVDVVLLAPNGVIALAVFAPDGDEIEVKTLTQERHAQIEQHERSALYRLSLPYPLQDDSREGEYSLTAGPGEWKAVLTLNQDRYVSWLRSLTATSRESAQRHGVRYTVMVGARSRLTMRARGVQSGTEVGDKMSIEAEFFRDGKSFEVPGATVVVEVTRPSDGTIDQLSLQSGGDGFNGVLDLPVNGVHACRVVARGEFDGHPFQREHTFTAAVWDPSMSVDEEHTLTG